MLPDPHTANLQAMSVPPNATIRETLHAISEGQVQIALVVDTDQRLLGTVTDGDIRLALLAGTGLDDPVEPAMRRDFSWVPVHTPRTEILDLMKARSIQQMPVLDETGKLIGLHHLKELIGANPKPNWAVIMAGGEGRRLHPLTETVPKPMIPVAGRPILERLVLNLAGYGIRTIYLAIHYLGDMIEDHFGDGSHLGCQIRYLREPEPLGTGGALSLLPEVPSEPLLVLNGDLLTQFNPGDLLDFHLKYGHAATVGIREYLHTVPFGVVDVSDMRIRALREKPVEVWTVNAGIYVFDPSLLQEIPYGTHYPMTNLIETCFADGLSVGAFPIDGEWADVGRMGDLLRARGERVKP